MNKIQLTEKQRSGYAILIFLIFWLIERCLEVFHMRAGTSMNVIEKVSTGESWTGWCLSGPLQGQETKVSNDFSG